DMRRDVAHGGLDALSADAMRRMKRSGFGDAELAHAVGATEMAVRERREGQQLKPVYKRVDTCAAEFESFTPYLYSSYEPTCEANPNAKNKVVILGSGPNRIGQGIEFDYCCCHAAFALRDEGYETIMVNCNPETVSTDYDTATWREEARVVAAEIGFPVVVRPSYVLGGRAMAIVYDTATLDRYMTHAVDASPEHPVLVDKFLEDAFEFDVDAVADQTGAV